MFKKEEKSKVVGPKTYDVGVIGAGIAGLNAAIHASKNGLSVVLFERRDLGGLSLNGGDLLMSELYRRLKIRKRAEVLNLNEKLPPFDLLGVFKKMKHAKRNYLREYLNLFDNQNDVTFINKRAHIINKNKIKAGDEEYNVNNIILATGAKVREYESPKHINPKKLKNYIYSHELMELTKVPSSLVIVGGAPLLLNLVFSLVTSAQKPQFFRGVLL